MIWGDTFDNTTRRRNWFAWRPVQLTNDGRWVWLQKIYRYRWENRWGWDYYLPKENENEK